jgi:hypothetical protein
VRGPFARSVSVPPAVVAAAGLARREKVLAGAEARSGAWLLGTRAALVLVEPDRGGSVRIPWQQVETADWDRDEGRLVIAEVGEYGAVRPRHAFEIDEPGLFLDLLRERVTATVLLQRRVTVTGKAGFFVIARRAAEDGGEVSWAFQFDPGVDPQDPAVKDAAERALRAAQDEIGM